MSRLMEGNVEQVKEYLLANKDKFTEAGIAKFVVLFEGSGDEGQVESIEAFDNPDADAEADQPMQYDIPDEFRSMLELLEPDDNYQDGLGGGGQIHCFVADQKIKLDSYFIIEERDPMPDEEY